MLALPCAQLLCNSLLLLCLLALGLLGLPLSLCSLFCHLSFLRGFLSLLMLTSRLFSLLSLFLGLMFALVLRHFVLLLVLLLKRLQLAAARSCGRLSLRRKCARECEHVIVLVVAQMQLGVACTFSLSLGDGLLLDPR